MAGGVIGALESDKSKETAGLYTEALRRGGAIVTAKVAVKYGVACGSVPFSRMVGI